MDEPDTDARVDQDPLLEFTTEPLKAEATAPEAVPPPAAAPCLDPDAVDILSKKIERLERAVERMSRQLGSTTSQVTTLVAAKKNNGGNAAMAAIAVGVAAAVWFWWFAHTGNVAPIAAPVVETPVAAAPVDAEPVKSSPQNTPQSPGDAAPAAPVRAVAMRDTPRRIDYQGTLSIDASPAAQVFINRRPAGQTPVRLTNLKAGSHLVWIEREGFRRFTRVVQVPADRVTRVWATLDPLGAR